MYAFYKKIQHFIKENVEDNTRTRSLVVPQLFYPSKANK